MTNKICKLLQMPQDCIDNEVDRILVQLKSAIFSGDMGKGKMLVGYLQQIAFHYSMSVKEALK